MKLRVLGSSSKGNTYYIEDDKSIIVIEAGIPFKFVKPEIDFKISKIKGVITSHEHGDHAKYIPDYLSYSIPVFGTQQTVNMYGGIAMEHMKTFKIGQYKIMPFELKHDVPIFGFLISHPEAGKILFCTDTYYVPYKFKGLNHILIEVNYSKQILRDNINKGSIHPVQAKRVLSSHMELQTTKNMLKANDLSQVVNIVLLHLSDSNSNARLFKKEIEAATGKMAYIANKGLEISLTKHGF